MAKNLIGRIQSALTGRVGSLILTIIVALAVFLAGYFSKNKFTAPAEIVRSIKQAYHNLKNRLVYFDEDNVRRVTVYDKSQAYKGLNLSFECTFNRDVMAYLKTMDGTVINTWDLNYSKISFDESHLPKKLKFEEAGIIPFAHGGVLCSNGDIIFNFEYRTLVRMDKDGNIVWQLPYCTHHSVTYNCDSSAVWVCGMKVLDKRNERFHGNYKGNFRIYTFLEVSLDGEILQEIDMNEIFSNSKMWGLLYDSGKNQLISDYTHLNDVDCYCDSTASNNIDHGDLIFSLCNLNDMHIYDVSEGVISHSISDLTVFQHDPDFIGGDTISVFDNFKVGRANNQLLGGSRILKINLKDNSVHTVFQGSENSPFQTGWGGKHQWLPNGNVLITESQRGRAFELNSKNEIVWEYKNPKFQSGWVLEVQRVPLSMLKHYQ